MLLVGYVVGLCDICDWYGVLFVVDEVICGFGWFGEYFGLVCYGLKLDIIMFVKGIVLGYVLFGGVIVSDVVVDMVFDGL